jgi:hypothetical protein
MTRKNVQNTTWAILFVVLAAVRISGQATGDGGIIGRITDVQGGVIPGARVSITSGDERWETMTDAEGRFALRSLRLGTYNVAVELPVFFTRSGRISLSQTVHRAHVGWRLEVGCLEEGIVHVILAPREAAPLADGILHVQVKSDDGPVLASSRPECSGRVVQSYTADVLNAVVRRNGDRRSTVQMFLSSHQVRLQVGAEYVALVWPGGFAGAGLVFPVVSGRISSGAGELLTGMAVEEALEALGEWSRDRPQ